MNTEYQPLHHKYRPDRFDDLVGQEAITTTLKQALISNKIAPAYLFSGPRGTGKTSSARILARSLNCLDSQNPTVTPCGKCNLCKTISSGTALDVIEIDAASNTGVENIRELIEKAQFAPVQARWKVYVIDECHMLSTAAFNALLKTLEEPPSKVVFILATTDPQRVLPTILSRCMRFEFRRITSKNLIEHLKMIAKKEFINIELEALELIAKKAQGGLRDAESMLDQLSLLDSPIKVSSIWNLLGAIPEKDLLKLTDSIIKKDPLLTLQTSRELIDNGKEAITVLQGVASILRDLILYKVAPDKPELCSASKDSIREIQIISEQISLDELLNFQGQLKNSEIQLRQSIQPRLWLEIILLGLLSNNENKPSINSNNNQSFSSNKKYIKPDINQKSSTNVDNNEKSLSSDQIDNRKKDIAPEKTASSEENLSEKWNQIVSMLELPSTKMLLSQQAKLINLNNKNAEIIVSSKWINMLESRKKLIEEAVTKALGSRRNIILVKQNEKTQINENYNPISNPNLESQPSKQNIKVNFKKTITPSKINNPGEEIHTKSQQQNINDSQNKTNNSVASKAEKFANFFNGEIVDLDNQ